MSVAEPPKTVTAEDLADRPDDGVERDLIRGELRERPMTRRNPEHSGVESNVAFLLIDWLKRRPEPRGKVHSGEAGFRLRRVPETFVGIDVAYVSPEMVAARDRKLKFYEGPPVLAVEILSSTEQRKDIMDKVEIYLEVGSVAWVVDPDFETVTVYRPGAGPETFHSHHELSADPYLPGFRVRVAEFFE
jgi:Uma2 family endonuclease